MVFLLLPVCAVSVFWVLVVPVGLGAVLRRRGRAPGPARRVRWGKGAVAVARRWLRRLFAPLGAVDLSELEAAERRRLLDRPWEEEFLHWSYDGWRWRLHGHLTPPGDGLRRSTTTSGWCPAGQRRSPDRARRGR